MEFKTDYIYMNSNNPSIDLILKKTIFLICNIPRLKIFFTIVNVFPYQFSKSF